MNKVVEFHDSYFESIIKTKNDISLVFDTLVNFPLDEAGDELLELTGYNRGKIILKNCLESHDIPEGKLFDGNLNVDGKKISLVPVGITNGKLKLTINHESGDFEFNCSQIFIKLEDE